MLTFVLLCLQGTGGQAYAQEDKAGERRIRYSSSYLKEAEIPEAPEEYLEEGEITYRLVGTEIEACREELLASAGLSEDEVQIESASWEGDAYQDEAGIWCRNAAVQAKRRVWDCRAVYGGTVRLPAYERYRRRMEYEKAEPDVEEMTEIEADPGTLVETETAPVENLPLPFWRRWIHYGLTISVSLLLLLLAWLGFRQLRRMAREKNER